MAARDDACKSTLRKSTSLELQRRLRRISYELLRPPPGRLRLGVRLADVTAAPGVRAASAAWGPARLGPHRPRAIGRRRSGV